MRILLLDIGNQSTNEIYSYLLPKVEAGKLRKISVNEQTIGDYLLIPDSFGLNCNTKAFMPHYRVPPCYPGQHQWLEFWRLENSEFYKNSGVKIVGFGDSAFLVYDTILGGKLEVDNLGQMRLIEDSSIALVEDNNFSTLMHRGYTLGSTKRNLDDFYSHLAGHRNNPPNNDAELVKVSVGPGPVKGPPTILRQNNQ